MSSSLNKIVRNTPLIAGTAMAVVLVFCSAVAATIPMAVAYDPANGFRVWNSMENGAAPNYMRAVSRANISKDQDFFYAAFTPGQYMLPGLLMRSGLSLGRSIWLLTVISMPLALGAYYYLYQHAFQFSTSVSILSCLVIAVAQPTLHSFLVYSGGRFLQFAGFPFVLAGSIGCIRKGGLALCLLPLLFLAGAFLKLSFAVIGLSVVLSVLLEQLTHIRLRSVSSWIVRPTATFVAFVAFYLVLYLGYTSKGATAARIESIGGTSEQYWFSLWYSLAAVSSGIVSMFSALAQFGSPLHFLSATDGAFHSIAHRWLAVVAMMGAASTGLVVWAYRRSVDTYYRAFLLGFVAVHVLAITVIVVNGNLILEDRHFWPVSALLLPGLLAAIEELKSRSWRKLAVFVFAAFGLYGISSYVVNLKRALQSGRSSTLGITLLGRSQRFVDTVEELDQQLSDGRNILYFNDPALAMLVRHTPVAFEAVIDPDNRVYFGTAGRVIMVVDRKRGETMPDPGVTATFHSYDKWQRIMIDSTDFYYSGGNLFLR